MTDKIQDNSLHAEELARIQKDSTLQQYPDVPRKTAKVPHRERLQSTLTSAQDNYQARSAVEWVETFVPMVKWLREYKFKDNIMADIVAGITVTTVIIPQSMSFAKLAGMPVQFGLYCSFMPIYAYSVFGTSRQLAVGTSAVSSLTFNSVMMPLVNPSGAAMTEDLQNEYNMLAVKLALLVGIIWMGMGLLRLGFVTTFLSRAVIGGFTTGSALIIGFSQVKYILGYNVPGTDRLPLLIKSLIQNISKFNYKTFVLGILSIVVIVGMKNVGMKYKKWSWIKTLGPITVCVITILVSWLANLSALGIPTVTSIPPGLPPITIDLWAPLSLDLLKPAITIVIVGFMESISVAKKCAAQHKYELDASLELFGLGMANFIGSMFSVYPVVGSFSRTAVNNEAGALSAISGIITATLVMVVLLCLTFVFEYLPYAVLAAIVISAVISLLEFGEAVFLWKVHKLDCLTWVVSFLCTILFGVQIGLASAVILSLLITQYESAYPHTAVLGRLPGSTVYRNVKQYPNSEQYQGLVICRIDAPLYFANSQYIREKLDKYETLAQETRKVQYVILDLSPVGHIDTTAVHSLQEIVKDYQTRGISLCLCNPGKMVMERLVKSGFADLIGYENIFVSEHHAVNICLGRLAGKADDRSDGDVGVELVSDVENGVPSFADAHDYGANSNTGGKDNQQVEA